MHQPVQDSIGQGIVADGGIRHSQFPVPLSPKTSISCGKFGVGWVSGGF